MPRSGEPGHRLAAAPNGNSTSNVAKLCPSHRLTKSSFLLRPTFRRRSPASTSRAYLHRYRGQGESRASCDAAVPEPVLERCPSVLALAGRHSSWAAEPPRHRAAAAESSPLFGREEEGY